MDTTRLVHQRGRLIGGIYLQRLNSFNQYFFSLGMYLKLLSHSDKQSFPLLSERKGLLVGVRQKAFISTSPFADLPFAVSTIREEYSVS